MVSKIVFVACAQILFVQAVFSQYISGNSVVDNNIYLGNSGLNSPKVGLANAGVTNAGIVSGVSGVSGLNVVSSGPLIVTSISPIGPSGLAVASENAIEGILSVSGSLPYLSAVAFEGSLPTAGSGVATCGCGTGEVAIVSEGLASANRGRLY